jgi:hypothetical protein
MRSVRSKPVGRPVEGAEKRARRDRRIDRTQLSTPASRGEERAHAALVPVALGHDRIAQRRWKRVHLEVCRRPFEVIDQAADVRQRERAQPLGQRTSGAPRLRERREESIQRPILAEEQNLVLAAEVVVEVRGGQVRRQGDVAHTGGGIAARPKNASGRSKYLHAAGFGADRTAVR